MSVAIREPLLSDYSIRELPSQEDEKESGTALAARVEFLEAESKRLTSHINAEKAPLLFRIEQIADDSLVKFYTGFVSRVLFLGFFFIDGSEISF
jgi:hypothetical protein